MKLVIERAKWLRGEGSRPSRLFRQIDGKMCCLGFLGKACGLQEIDMFCGSPDYSTHSHKYPTSIVSGSGFNTPITDKLMKVNDRVGIADAERESNLKDLFRTIGIEVEFV